MPPMPLPQPPQAPSASTQLASLDWLLHSLASPQNAQRWMGLVQAAGATPNPAPGRAQDARFAHPAWQVWPYNAIRDRHQDWANRLVDSARLDGMQPHHQQLMAFLARQWVEIGSPANWPWSNPEVAEKGLSTLGMSLFKGAHLFWQDLPGLVSRSVASITRSPTRETNDEDLPP